MHLTNSESTIDAKIFATSRIGTIDLQNQKQESETFKHASETFKTDGGVNFKDPSMLKLL